MTLEVSRALVLGFGVSGTAAVAALIERGVTVRAHHYLHGESPAPALMERGRELELMGAEVSMGGDDPHLFENVDVVIASPGLPPSNPILARASARGLRIWSEIELGYRMIGGVPLVAITGTNGKTTTTTLLTRMLASGGTSAVAAGNEILPLVKAAPETWGKTVVLEVSSFQLFFIETFHPRIAVVLNVGDDHYDWHEGPEDYLRAKARITEKQGPDDLLIVRSGDEGCLRIAAASRARVGVFGADEPDRIAEVANAGGIGRLSASAGVLGEALVVDVGGTTHKIGRVSDIRLRGVHNIENVLAASLAAFELGMPAEDVAAAAASFEGLPHRMAFVAERGGVTYIDDSKATNIHATVRSLEGLDRVVLIVGGRAKGVDLRPLLAQRPKLEGLVTMGEAASEIESLFAGEDLAVKRASDVEEAVRLASSMAGSGSTVLLSPACSSVDQYTNYAERGERFSTAVRSL